MPTAVRWLVLVVSVVGGWLLVAWAAAAYYSRLPGECLSAPDLPECKKLLYLIKLHLVPGIAAALSVTVAIALAYAMAPARRLWTARLVFGGAVTATCFYAILFAVGGRLWPVLIAITAALCFGLVALIAVANTHDRRVAKGLAHDA